MQRLKAMIVKEMWAILRDPKSRLVLILPPLLQLFIFTFATTLDVSNIDVGVLDMSSGIHSREITERVAGSPRFRHIVHLTSPNDLQDAIDGQKILAAMVFTPDFDRNVETGTPATVGLVLDGRRSNAAQIASGYIAQITGEVGVEAMQSSPATARRLAAPDTVVTNWYNPSLDYKWFTLPSLVALIMTTSSIAITSQTVARERELGTFDQLMVSPMRVHEILIGKMMAPFVIGAANGLLYMLISIAVFGLPFTGSLLLFCLSLGFFLLALIGVGMLISAATMTQQQAFLGSFVATVPLILLSGFASPIDNMPGWLQVVTHANPLRYFLIITHGLFLKGMPLSHVFNQLWPMAIIACITLGASAWLFRARME